MVMISRSPYEGTPKSTSPDIARDPILDSAPEDLSDPGFEEKHQRLLILEAERARLATLERVDPRRIDLATQFSGAALNIMYFRSKRPTDEVPITLIPGLGAFPEAMEALAVEIARLDRDVVVADVVREQENFKALHPKHFFDPLLSLQQGLVTVMEEVADSRKVTKARGGSSNAVRQFDPAGWSLGNKVGTGVSNFLITEEHDKIVEARNAQSIAGAGNTGEEGMVQVKQHGAAFLNLIKRDVFKGAPLMFKASPNPEAFKQGAIRHNLKAPLRTAREAIAITWAPSVDDDVDAIIEAGHLYSANSYDNDALFHHAKVTAHMGDRLSFHTLEPGEHTHPATHPREAAINIVAVSNAMSIYALQSMNIGLRTSEL